MTGMVTASCISLIIAGSLIRATPPSYLISAGILSRAMTRRRRRIRRGMGKDEKKRKREGGRERERERRGEEREGGDVINIFQLIPITNYRYRMNEYKASRIKASLPATAPAASAILACSTLMTSMMTPPLSILARPALIRKSGSDSKRESKR